MNKNKMNKKGTLAISQILILIIGIIAIAYAAGSQIGIVSSGEGEGETTDSGGEGEEKEEPPEPLLKDTKDNDEDTTTPDFYTEYPPKTYSDYITQNEDDGSYDINEEGILEDPKLGEKFLEGLQSLIVGEGIKWTYEAGKEKILGKEVGGKIIEKTAEEAVKKTVVKEPGTLSKFWTKAKSIYKMDGTQTIVWAWVGYFVTKQLTAWLVQNERNADPIMLSAEIATGALTLYGVGQLAGLALLGPVGWVAAAIVLAVAVATALFTYQVFSKEVMFYHVSAWQPVDGGSWCEKCNEIPTGCSEYQCRSFGKGCGLINKNTEYEECVWEFQDDRRPPILTPLRGILEDGMTFEEFNISSPPERGMRIIDTSNEDNCVAAFSSLTIGIQSDENAICRWDYERRESFDQMADSMNEGNAATMNHTLYLPNSATASQESLANIGMAIEEDREYGFFIKCKDINGNENPLHFLAEFCVETGPDLNAPEILGTNYEQGSYIQFNLSNLPLQVYTNEPADCRWDHDNLDYDTMAYNMSRCSQNAEDRFAGFSYGCAGNLTGFQDRQENNFYIKCKDKPWWNEGDEGRRYENRDSFVLNLKGTEPLVISSVTVNGEESGAIIKGTSDEVKAVIEVTASAGAEQGKSRCSYLSGGIYYNFYNDGNTDYVLNNKQRLWLVPGNYSYNISCTDIGGNTDQDVISFALEKDETGVVVVRAFQESNNLKIITDEEATCVYDTYGCLYNFDDGLAMQSYDQINHFVDWNSDTTYHIKCRDEFGNQPAEDRCSIEVSPFEV